MAVNPQGFVTPEQDFRGLYNLSNNLEQKKLRDEELQRQRQGKKSASDKYFTNYLDPKDRFTGTKFDPEVNKLLGEALKQAYDLSSTGADDTEIFTAISPLVNKVNDYSQKAMAVNAQKKQAVEFLKGQKGIDINKFSTAFDDAVFNEVDGSGNKKMRELSQIDPNYNYIDQVLKDGDIYNAEGFDDYVSKSGKNTTVEDVSVYNKDKSMRRTKAEMTMPSFMVSEKDERGAHTGFVPQYDIATDGEQPVLHDFLNEEGITESAPVRLVTQDVFNSLPPNTKAYLRQEAKKYAQEKKIDISSPQVENFAKALAYDELKRSAKQYSTLKELQVQKAAPTVIHNTTNVNTGGGKDAGAEWVKRAVGAMEKGDKQGMEDVFSELLAGDMKELKGVEDLGGGKVKVTVMPNPKYDMVGQLIQESTKPVERVFDINDRQLPYRLANLRQTIMGGDVKLERTRFDRPKTDTPKPPAKKEIKRSDIATKAAAAGYSAKEYEALLKKNNIKIVE